MLPEVTPRLTTTELLHLIEEAKNAELCRDLDLLRKILQRVWNNNNCLPTFNEYEPALRAELLRLCGFFLTFYGRSRNLRDYQIQAKDVLTNAIEVFQSENLLDKAAESKIILAFCYWNTGEVSECEAVLSLVEADFNKNKLHPIYLQIQINRLLILTWNKKYNEAIKIINKFSSSMEFCKDSRLKAMFHSEAGIIFRRANFFENALYHFREAIRITSSIENQRFVALNLNNLSLLYRDIRDFKESHRLANQSLEIYSDLKDEGWIPHVLDTKALIYIDENKYSEALKIIEQALDYFYKGEDYNGLTDALWTKIRCLLRLGRKHEALIFFSELQQTASEHIGEIAVKKFANNLADEIYVLKKLPLPDEVLEFKKSQVGAAMIEANGAVGKAARILGLKNHQALSDILNKQFPGLLNELGFQRRARRNSVVLKKRTSRSKNLSPDETPQYWEIAPLNLQDKQISFDFEVGYDKFETYYFDKYFMKGFGIEKAAIVAVVPVTKLKPGMLIVGANTNKYFVGKAEYDKWTEIYFILDANGNPFPLDRKAIIGEPVGYCFSSEIEKENIRFSRLSL